MLNERTKHTFAADCHNIYYGHSRVLTESKVLVEIAMKTIGGVGGSQLMKELEFGDGYRINLVR